MGQCLCSWCVETRQRNRPEIPDSSRRDAEAPDLRGLAAYDQARSVTPRWGATRDRVARLHASVIALDAELRQRIAGARARDMRAARERAWAPCP